MTLAPALPFSPCLHSSTCPCLLGPASLRVWPSAAHPGALFKRGLPTLPTLGDQTSTFMFLVCAALWWRQVAKLPGSDMKYFTRILHRSTPDALMDVMPTVRAGGATEGPLGGRTGTSPLPPPPPFPAREDPLVQRGRFGTSPSLAGRIHWCTEGGSTGAPGGRSMAPGGDALWPGAMSD